MILAPMLCTFFFTSLMSEGLPKDMPAGVVDLDMSTTSRSLVRNLDAFSGTAIVAHYPSVTEARWAMQKGEIYGYYLIPQGLSREAQAQRQPKVSFYTNNAYLIAGSFLYRDMRTMSELASGSAARSVLYGRGATETQAMTFLQPIVLDTHVLGNPWLNYSIYLSNIILPAVMGILIMLVTAYSIGSELKEGTSQVWLEESGGSIFTALAGKLLPHTLIFVLVGWLIDIYLYGYLHFPCQGGIVKMMLLMLCYILALQGLAITICGLFPTLRMGLSVSSLWAVLPISTAGFSYSVLAMPPTIQTLTNLFPLRHYYIIYVDQALHDYGWATTSGRYAVLLLFVLLPLLTLRRLKSALLHDTYVP